MRCCGCEMQVSHPQSNCSEKSAELSRLPLRMASTAADTTQIPAVARFSLTTFPAASAKVIDPATQRAPSAAQHTGHNPGPGSLSHRLQPHQQQPIPGVQLESIAHQSALVDGRSRAATAAAPTTDGPDALLSALAAMLTAAERDSDPVLAVTFHHCFSCWKGCKTMSFLRSS